MIKHLLAIALIFIGTSVAWAILGGTVLQRTYATDQDLESRVGQLWGTEQTQQAPYIFYETTKKVEDFNEKGIRVVRDAVEEHAITLDKSAITADIKMRQRQKGLLWYSTYTIAFAGNYAFTNPTDEARSITCRFSLPATHAIYDNLKFTLDGKNLANVLPNNGSIIEKVLLKPHQQIGLSVSYESQGLGKWAYTFGGDISNVKNFHLVMKTDFDAIDFPVGAMSPSQKEKATGTGWNLVWNYSNLLTGYNVALTMPQKLNPGPWVSKVVFFAPISLFLFFFVLYMLATLKQLRIHPMNYFFLGCSFFSFHLLLAYLVDQIQIEYAFAIASIVSVFLVVSYMRLVVFKRFAYVEVAISQFVYLVFFSYTFFFERYTGLIVTILSIATLYLSMQYTAKIDWHDVFERQKLSKKTKANLQLAEETNA